MNQAFGFLIKVGIAFAILWLVWDEFDLTQFAYVIERPALALLLPVTWLVNQLLVTLRLTLILKALERSVTYADVLRANMSALFFGNVLPGTVTIDVVKYFYIKQHDPNIPATWLIMVFVLDRAVGLFCILFWCSCFGLLLNLKSNVDAIPFWYLPGAILLLGIVGGLAALKLKDLVKKFSWSQRLLPLIDMLDLLFHRKKLRQLAGVAFSGLAAILVLLSGTVALGGILHEEISGDPAILAQYFLVPLSLITSMIPIAPLGIGVSQFTLSVAYEALDLVPSVGVSVSTWSQLGMLSISVIFGGYFFVRGRKAAEKPENDTPK